MQSTRVCTVTGCDRPYRARGWCATHWWRMKHHGSLDTPPKTIIPLEDRFWPKVEATGFCWLWRGAIDNAGYGVVNVGGRRVNRAHRVSYEILVGPIANGLHLDHLCRVRHCLNPDHLEPVSPAENMRRGFAPAARVAATDLCGRGHSMADAYVRPGNGYRMCRVCQEARRKKRNHDRSKRAA